MKSGLALCLAGSLCLNLILFAILRSRPAGLNPQSIQISAQIIHPEAQPPGPIKQDPPKWKPFEGTNYTSYMDYLRELGFPPEVIQDILLAEIDRVYKDKRSKLVVDSKPRKWWTTIKWNAPEQMQFEAAALDLEKQKHEEYLKLFGFDPNVRKKKQYQRYRDYTEWMVSFLPEEKFFDAVHIADRYRIHESAIASRGFLDEEDNAEFFRLRDAKYRELHEILSPHEFEEYKLRASRLADYMRAQFSGIQLTESEFRQVFRVLEPYETILGSPEYGPAGDLERMHARAQTDDLVRRVLGPERFFDYHGVRDPYFNSTLDFAKREGAGLEAARKIYKIKIAAQEEIARLGSATPEMTSHVQSAVAAVLGDAIFSRYTNTAGATWMQRLGKDRIP